MEDFVLLDGFCRRLRGGGVGGLGGLWIGEVEGQRRGMTKMGWHCRLWGYCLLAQLATGGVQ